LEKRLRRRPSGVASKKAMGARRRPSSMRSWSARAAAWPRRDATYMETAERHTARRLRLT